MNDKFFKLGRAATLWCCDNLNPDTPKEEWDAEWEDKFANLIIRDCVSQIAMIGVSNWENDDVVWAVDKSIENIRKHFGVE